MSITRYDLIFQIKNWYSRGSLDTVSPHSAHMMLSHHVEQARAPIYHVIASEQLSPCVMQGNFMTALPSPQPGPCIGCAPHLQPLEPAIHAGINIMTFAHSVHTQANTIKFSHQSLGNPKISTLLKATRKGFLKGCPNILEPLILRYLNLSPTTAKAALSALTMASGVCGPKPPCSSQSLPYLMHPSSLLPKLIHCVATLPGGPDVSRTRVWRYHRPQPDWG